MTKARSSGRKKLEKCTFNDKYHYDNSVSIPFYQSYFESNTLIRYLPICLSVQEGIGISGPI